MCLFKCSPVLKEFSVTVVLLIFYSTLTMFWILFKRSLHLWSRLTDFFESLFDCHVKPHFARTYHWKQLENAISKQWNLELSISINEIHLKINTICQIIKKQFSKAPIKERRKKWTLCIMNAYVIFCLTMFAQTFKNCMCICFLNGNRTKFFRFQYHLYVFSEES